MREPGFGFLAAETHEVLEGAAEPFAVPFAGEPEHQALLAIEAHEGLDPGAAQAPVQGASGEARFVECEVASHVFEDGAAAGTAQRDAVQLDLARNVKPPAGRTTAIGDVQLGRRQGAAVGAEIRGGTAGRGAERARAEERQEIPGRPGSGQGDPDPPRLIGGVRESCGSLLDRGVEDRATNARELQHRPARPCLGLLDPDRGPALGVGELDPPDRARHLEFAAPVRERNGPRVTADPHRRPGEASGTHRAVVPAGECDGPAVGEERPDVREGDVVEPDLGIERGGAASVRKRGVEGAFDASRDPRRRDPQAPVRAAQPFPAGAIRTSPSRVSS